MENTSIEIDSKINELFVKTLVTQKIKNDSENPIELKIYVYKKVNCIFSSFSATIGDSVTVKSKIIQKENAQEKYTDSISSGNAAIYIFDDPTNKNRIIINMGNIPPKEELTFISEFIYYTESSDRYEFELFRNLPILVGKNSIYQDNNIKGQVEIKTKNKINKIEKKILSDKLKINEERYLDKKAKNNYLIKYEYYNLNNLSSSLIYENEYLDYLPSSKIYFDSVVNFPIIYSQKSLVNEKEENFIIQYRYINKKSKLKKNNELNLNPALFIFLIDQSGSMSDEPIKVASKALLLFLQSLPVGSYYQIIGFGSTFKKYDEEPKVYNQENIKNSIKLVEELKADLGGTNIYAPLQNIYDSNQVYDKIKLPRNIFLLTDGEIENKKNTLKLIEINSDKYPIYSIGIGNNFDEDLIKNAGVVGKGNYNFCKNIKDLNQIIATEINNASNSYISNFNIKSSIDDKNIYKTNIEEIIIKKNRIVNLGYIIENKENNINENKINIEIKYKKYEKNDEEIKENYVIIPEVIPAGEELSKLIINNYLLNNIKLKEDERTKLALKYQICSENTSLFAEIELSKKINKEMKQEIIGYEENNKINNFIIDMEKTKLQSQKMKHLMSIQSSMLDNMDAECYSSISKSAFYSCESRPKSKESFGFLKNIGNSVKGLFSFGKKNEIKTSCPSSSQTNDVNKDNIMKIINTLDFIEGSWDINEQTKIIKEKYEKKYELLKNLKDKNIDDKIAITILIIYFIYKEHPELLKELIMIIKKGKLFIQEKTKENYENIIKESRI